MGTFIKIPQSKRLRKPRNRFEEKLHKKHLWEQLWRIWHHDCFDDPKQGKAIMSPMPGLQRFQEERVQLQQQQLDPKIEAEIIHLYREPLLNKGQEQHLFRQMNYVKYKVKKELDLGEPDKHRRESITQMLCKSADVKRQLVRSNLRLAMDIAGTIANQLDMHDEMSFVLSEANLATMRAVECFDWTRGLKFSTYSTWSIRKNLWRDLLAMKKKSDMEISGFDQHELEELLVDKNTLDRENLDEAERKNKLRQVVDDMFRMVEEREKTNPRFQKHPRRKNYSRTEIVRYYDMSDTPPTLKEIGQLWGVSRQRVREIRREVLDDMREIILKGEVIHPEELTELLNAKS
jgi:RNA polymerase primary sigma factor